MPRTLMGKTPEKALATEESRAARRMLMHTARRVPDGSEQHRLAMTAIAALDDLLVELDPPDPKQVQQDRFDEVLGEIECLGHPAGPFDPMGETVYCDGSCRRPSLSQRSLMVAEDMSGEKLH